MSRIPLTKAETVKAGHAADVLIRCSHPDLLTAKAYLQQALAADDPYPPLRENQLDVLPGVRAPIERIRLTVDQPDDMDKIDTTQLIHDMEEAFQTALGQLLDSTAAEQGFTWEFVYPNVS